MSKIKGLDKLQKKLTQLPKLTIKELKDIIYENSILLNTYLKTRVLTGGTSKTRLAVGTGKTRASARPLQPKVTAEHVKGGVVFGTAYTMTHVGKPGEKKTIRPKKAKALTIPLNAMKTKAGVSRGSAQGAYVKSHFDSTFFGKSKKGNVILFGTKKLKTMTKIIPLFVLKTKVIIPARIHPELLLNWVEKRIITSAKRIEVN